MAARAAAVALALGALSEASYVSSKGATEIENAAEGMANPIRKVVTMLQKMEAKVQEEAKKEEELYNKFMCYCKNGDADLGQSIELANTKVPELESNIRENIAKKAQLQQELKDHQVARSEAKDAMAQATAIREKAAAAFKTESGELKANLDALTGAITAIEKGMSGGFLQTKTAVAAIKKLALSGPNMNDADREDLLAFLSGGQGSGYSPKSGEITGILNQLKDDMDKQLSDITAAEKADVASYEELMAAKTKEVGALSASIESKSQRIGDLGVEIAMQKHDLEDTQGALAEDQKFLANLKENCEEKRKEWEVRTATRGEELVAISETIKMLNSDDSLELFKKTLPSPGLLQLETSEKSLRDRALSIVAKAAEQRPKGSMPALDFVSLALKGKKGGFDKVIKMIDNMVALLKKEQYEDDAKKDYCATQFDQMDDKKKGLEQGLADHETAIADAEESLETTAAEIKALTAGVKELDKSVKEATETRQQEHEEFTELQANNNAAKEVLAWAKNRLAKFYAPNLYKPAPKRELADVQLTSDSSAFALVQIQRHQTGAVRRADPGPAPETYGEYEKKGEESQGVMSMIDLLVRDLDKELQEAGVDEKNAQKEYEKMMADSAEKRAADSASITGKESLKAELGESLEMHKEGKRATTKDLMATGEYIQTLHGECDWLVQYYDTRKEARSSEVEALGNAKAVLAGADYALVQKEAEGHSKSAGASQLRR
eukprot:TRINITY_DN408_c2_g4_i1.p2 TRINITY_DN408_c2_g4~~TRINITY_DN408_c2_g4_i1.p2  ORF type:complete len:724 (-),score=335.41 TRINITY_DN408_c2_g4_i1:93-2264(-)